MKSESAAHSLNSAAQLLTAAGRADTHPGVRIHALLAAEHLRVAGANPDLTPPVDDDIPERLIRSALDHLMELPSDTFTDADVLAAAGAARTALARTEQR